jgi:hypothetical protein
VSGVATCPAPGELAEARDYPRGPLSLEDRLNEVLTAVRTEGGADCPVCQSPMTAAGTGACCDGCGATLS